MSRPGSSLTTENLQSHALSPMNYTHALQTEITPTKEQAIIVDTIDGTPIQEYALAVASKIGSGNIRHISKIFNNRVCVYVATKELVDKLTENHNRHAKNFNPSLSHA